MVLGVPVLQHLRVNIFCQFLKKKKYFLWQFSFNLKYLFSVKQATNSTACIYVETRKKVTKILPLKFWHV